MNTSHSHFHALIMAGGKGERFWPWSRETRPKQLLPLFGKKTMIEMTVDRWRAFLPAERIWIVTNAAQARQMARLMPKFPRRNFIVEPAGRDSTGAVMLGCATIAARDPDAVMALLPSDHLIKDTRAYLRVMSGCFAAAQRDPILMTIGIKPTCPSPCYGYIERSKPLARHASDTIRTYRVRRFVEKPPPAKARRLVQTGRHYWNAGMFVWSAQAICEAFEKHSPIHAEGWRALQQNPRRYLAGGFLKLPKISIDYAVMEKARNIAMAEGAFDWDDVGLWTSLMSHLPKDSCGNCLKGQTLAVDTRNCLVLGGERMIATLGVQDLVIVQTPDATLICSAQEASRVREIVRRLPPKSNLS
ncbi:MAG: sugar phosphate nucleotidyltransferase [Verrucomicrobiae bacterium]|nr:sugar phosphate nucleotidyltransferase [Verrucomicrobiae bacterium]